MSERRAQVASCRLVVQFLRIDQPIRLLALSFARKGIERLDHLRLFIERRQIRVVDEVHHQLLFRAIVDACTQRAAHLLHQRRLVCRAAAVFEHQFQDIVQVDLLRFQEIHLKHHIVPVHRRFHLRFSVALAADPLADVVVRRAVVLHRAFRRQFDRAHQRDVLVRQAIHRLERLHRLHIRLFYLLELLQLRELIVVLQNVFRPQILAEEFHEGLFVRLLVDLVRIRETLLQLLHDLFETSARFTRQRVGEPRQLLRVTPFQHHIFRVLVAEERNRVHRVAFQVAESHNVAERLRRVVDAVGARESLHQAVVAQVLVHKQRVQFRRVKAREEHSHHNQQIHLLCLHPACQVAVVVLKLRAVDAEVRGKHRVVVRDRPTQKLLRRRVHRRRFERLLIDLAHRILRLVRGEGENRRNPQRMFRLGLSSRQFLIVTLRRLHTAHRKHRIEALSALCAVRFQAEVAQDILRNLPNAIRVQHQLAIVRRRQSLLVAFRLRLLKFRAHIVVVHLKFQHLLVANRIGDHIGVQFAAEHARRRLRPRRVLREDRRAREAKLVVLLELPLQVALRLAEL